MRNSCKSILRNRLCYFNKFDALANAITYNNSRFKVNIVNTGQTSEAVCRQMYTEDGTPVRKNKMYIQIINTIFFNLLNKIIIFV